MHRAAFGALGLVLGLTGMVAGQQVTQEKPAPGTTESRRVSEILGSTVHLSDGRGFGKVEDIVIGPNNQVDYLVVSHDGRYVSLPWDVGRYEPAQRSFTFEVTPQAIQPLIFAPNAWPTFYDPTYTRRVQGVFPKWTPRGIGVRIGPAPPLPPR